MIVYRDRFPERAGERRTVVAIDPTRAEWDAFFPEGAAGVLCRDGRMIVGDGVCLDHLTLMGLAGVPEEQEAYRLQLYRDRVWAEVWTNFDEDAYLSAEGIRTLVWSEYGEHLDVIEERVRNAASKFMPDAEFRAIPLGDEQQCLLEGDEAFRCQGTMVPRL